MTNLLFNHCSLILWTLKRKFQPNPFKFWQPHHRHWCYGYFKKLNDFLLSQKYNIGQVKLSEDSRQKLEALTINNPTKTSVMFLGNHTNYIDPHILCDWFIPNTVDMNWISGLEPFEKRGGLDGYHINSVGCYSLDRGISDKRSLLFTQKALNDGEKPLLIFPEGEADYAPHCVRPFFAGAAQLLMRAAKTHENSEQSVLAVPFSIHYRFEQNPLATIKNHIRQLVEDCQKAYPYFKGVTRGYEKLDTIETCFEGLKQLTQDSVRALSDSLKMEYSNSLSINAISQLAFLILKPVIAEHTPEDVLATPPNCYLDWMTLKNKYRSLIAKKLYAPSIVMVEQALSKLKEMTAINEEGKALSLIDRWYIREWEKMAFGNTQLEQPISKRIRSLTSWFKGQHAFAMAKSNASDSRISQWKSQTNQCRQAKMLILLAMDMAHFEQNPGQLNWEAIDGLLIKLEILMLSRFNYRGAKTAELFINEPLNIKNWVASHSEADSPGLNTLLTQTLINNNQLYFISG